MTIYDEMAAMADELLREFGKALVLRRVTAGTYDPGSSSAQPATADYPATGALFDYALLAAGQTFLADTVIQVGDKQCLMSPAAVPLPVTGDLVIDGADTWQVQNVKAVNPAGTPVLYELHVRR
ncbi:hypothetical protein AB4Z48_18080 [Cupriavidus sp. 2TAF22]|uniref:hypothetical protein n=1 Tax=unclassified Cupriavidus TaxID=2640874 RepID=UPI003F8D9AA1